MMSNGNGNDKARRVWPCYLSDEEKTQLMALASSQNLSGAAWVRKQITEAYRRLRPGDPALGNGGFQCPTAESMAGKRLGIDFERAQKGLPPLTEEEWLMVVDKSQRAWRSLPINQR